jgi:hypothetical protein
MLSDASTRLDCRRAVSRIGWVVVLRSHTQPQQRNLRSRRAFDSDFRCSLALPWLLCFIVRRRIRRIHVELHIEPAERCRVEFAVDPRQRTGQHLYSAPSPCPTNEAQPSLCRFSRVVCLAHSQPAVERMQNHREVNQPPNNGTAANLRGGCSRFRFHESCAAPSVGRAGTLCRPENEADALDKPAAQGGVGLHGGLEALPGGEDSGGAVL